MRADPSDPLFRFTTALSTLNGSFTTFAYALDTRLPCNEATDGKFQRKGRQTKMISKKQFSRRTLLKGAAAGGSALLLSKVGFGAPNGSGPNTTTPSYVLPSVPEGVTLTPILTVGDAADNGYRMVGIPDGLGAFGDGQTFTLLMNHELTASAGSSGPGAVRAHGRSGAFVSEWTIDRRTLRVLAGKDHTRPLITFGSGMWR